MLLKVPIFHPIAGHDDPALAALPRGNGQVVGWAPEPVSTGRENLVPTPGFKSQTAQPIASIYTQVKKVYSRK